MSYNYIVVPASFKTGKVFFNAAKHWRHLRRCVLFRRCADNTISVHEKCLYNVWTATDNLDRLTKNGEVEEDSFSSHEPWMATIRGAWHYFPGPNDISIHWAPYLRVVFLAHTQDKPPLIFTEELWSWWCTMYVAEALCKLIVSLRSATTDLTMTASEH